MFNAHRLAREALAPFLRPLAPKAAPGLICTRLQGAETSFPLQWHSAHPLPQALALLRAAPSPCLLGVPLVAQMYLSGGHVCFCFTGEAYNAIASHILSSGPMPPLPESPLSDEVAYAIARMHMLARKGPAAPPCPDDPACRAALWLALGIADAPPRRQQARRLEAARALTGLLQGRSAAQQLALLPRLGPFGGCAARLLAQGWRPYGV